MLPYKMKISDVETIHSENNFRHVFNIKTWYQMDLELIMKLVKFGFSLNNTYFEKTKQMVWLT
jgi:hypothetical protein